MMPPCHRLLIDANIWISALLSPGGRCAQLVRVAIEQRHQIIISPRLLHDIRAGLSKPFCLDRYGVTASRVQMFVDSINQASIFVEPEDVVVAIRDPLDIHVISAALAGRATHLITGDRDLLTDENLKEWMRERGVTIVGAREYYELMGECAAREK